MVSSSPLRAVDACGFYILRLWRWQPLAVSVIACSLFAASISAMALAYYAETLDAARSELDSLRSRNKPKPVAAEPAASGSDLPAFDSAAFTAEFISTAKDVGLPTDELVYVLENSAAQPFQRYRITMEVKSGYTQVRKFVAALSSSQPHVVLDSMSCRRDDAMAPGLTCHMAFSAFFRKVSSV